jgi:hypothetical protein
VVYLQGLGHSAASLNTGRSQVTGAGTQTAALAFGGYTTAHVGNTEQWDGSSWSEVNDLNTATRGKCWIWNVHCSNSFRWYSTDHIQIMSLGMELIGLKLVN